MAVRRLDDGWRVFGTPFWGDFARGGISMRSWPLRTVGFLNQAREVAMTPITSSDATLRLLGCFLAFATDRASVERSLAVAVQLCAEVRSVEANADPHGADGDRLPQARPAPRPRGDARRCRPRNARELISEFRALLRKQRSYAFKPEEAATAGAWLKSGDVAGRPDARPRRAAGAGRRRPVWVPGPTPDEDALACHRLSPRARVTPRTPSARRRAARPRHAGRARRQDAGRCRAGSAIWRAASARWSRSPC